MINKVKLQEIIGRRIKKLRQGYSYSQEQLGKKVGVTRRTIIALEREEKLPSIIALIEIARVFNVSLDYMITENEDK